MFFTVKRLSSRKQVEPFRKWVDMKVDSKERELDSFIMCLSDQIDRIS